MVKFDIWGCSDIFMKDSLRAFTHFIVKAGIGWDYIMQFLGWENKGHGTGICIGMEME
jgi:hypothetical protein